MKKFTTIENRSFRFSFFFFLKMNDTIPPHPPVLIRQNAEVLFHLDETENKHDAGNAGEFCQVKLQATLRYYLQTKDDEKLARELQIKLDDERVTRDLQNQAEDEKIARQLQNQWKDEEFIRELQIQSDDEKLARQLQNQ